MREREMDVLGGRVGWRSGGADVLLTFLRYQPFYLCGVVLEGFSELVSNKIVSLSTERENELFTVLTPKAE